jgi:Zn-dependent protease
MFGYNIDKRMIYAILAILVVISLASMSAGEWLEILITIPAVIIAISFHEFAHALAADKLGDTTPRAEGRLTLNPAKHLDPVGFILLMFAHVGWGRPVHINPNNFTSNKSKSACEAIVALAGPLMNFVIAIVATFIYYALYTFLPMNQIVYVITLWVYMTIIVNIGLGVFNLIPLPPLDGEKIFRHILPYKVQAWLDKYTETLHVIFLILWFFGILGYIVSPVINVIYRGIFNLVGLIFGLF